MAIQGTNNNDNLVGTSGNDTIQGFNGDDSLSGLGGNDRLEGDLGNDTLSGGTGNDVFNFGYYQQNDVVIDFVRGQDKIDVRSLNIGDFTTLQKLIGNDGQDNALITTYFGGYLSQLKLNGINPNQLQATDFLLNTVNFAQTIDGDNYYGDQLFGGLGNDTIRGLRGNDVLFGNQGNDSLQGGDDNDTLYGEQGNDRFEGGLGNDTFYGGTGNDVFNFGYYQQNDVVIDFVRGEDKIDIRSLNIGDWTTLQKLITNDSQDNALITTYFGGYLSQLKLNGINPNQLQATDFLLNTVNFAQTIDGDNYYGDQLFGGLGNDTIRGLRGNDVLFGNQGNDSLQGGDDNDTLYGEQGNDRFEGGLGNDTFYGGTGNDVFNFGYYQQNDVVIDFVRGEDKIDIRSLNIGDWTTLQKLITNDSQDNALITTYFGGYLSQLKLNGINPNQLQATDFLLNTVNQAQTIDGDNYYGDQLFGGLGNDTIRGLRGNDVLFGNQGNDSLQGGDDNDTLYGEQGNDRFEGGLGNDTFYGGTGNDVFNFGYYQQNDVVIDFVRGEDKIDIRSLNIGDWTTLQKLITNDSQDNALITTYFGGYLSQLKLNGINPNQLQATDFLLNTVNQAQTIDGDNYYGDQLFGGLGNDTIRGLRGNDVLFGNQGNDSLQGGDDNDTLYGEQGNDRFEGGLGNDTFYGGTGNDVFNFGYYQQNDVVIDFVRGEDKIDIRSLNIGDWTTLQKLITNDSQDNALITTYFGGYLSQLKLNGINPNQLQATDFLLNTVNQAQTIDGDNYYGDQLFGGLGNDTIRGLRGNDVLFGNQGNDSLQGGDDNDTLYGEQGNDRFEGGLGNDTFYGGTGNDVFNFGYYQQNDVVIDFVRGQDKIDVRSLNIGDFTTLQKLIGNDGQDNALITTYFGNYLSQLKLNGINPNQLQATDFLLNTVNFAQTIDGSYYTDQVFGGLGNDTIRGFNGYDTLYGNQGNDSLQGNDGNDTLYGEEGNDRLEGGLGDDAFYGGTGNDVFNFGYYQQNDVVIDFVRGQDKIDVRSLNIGDFTTLQKLIGNDGQDNALITTYFGNYLSQLKLNGINPNQLQATDFLLNTVNFAQTIDGSYYTDQVFGGLGNDTIRGFNGYDTLYGNQGNDSLQGNDGNDTLYGEEGNDSLEGGSDDDALYGGTGNDTYSFLANTALGTDTIIETTTDGTDTISFSGTTVAVNVNLDVTTLQTVNSNLKLILSANNVIENATGGIGNDILIGNTLNNTLIGGDGNDQLQGLTGNDTYSFLANSALGTDTIIETTTGGTDTIDFSGTIVPVNVNLGLTTSQTVNSDLNLILSANNVIENATGGTGNDSLTGNTLNNILIGGDGNDQLQGLAGNDTYSFLANSPLGTDIITETTTGGTDTINFSGTTVAVNVNLGVATLQTVNSNLQLILSANNVIENATGGTGNDSLTGNTLNNTLIGGDGNDTYYFLANSALGTDTITETATGGTDTINFSGTTVPVNVNLGVTTSQTVNSNLKLILSANNVIENATGGTGNDSLTGNTLNNTLIGGGGNDQLQGLAGNDTYSFLANSALGTDTITETATGGTDTINFSGTTTAVNVNLGLTTLQTVNSNLKLILSANNVIENATGGTGNDNLTGNTLNNILIGGDGNDQLQGLAGNDTLQGGNGDDQLWGGLGNDVLTGGAGKDKYLFQSNGVFNTSLGIDYITQFEAGQDQIVLSKTTFNAVTNTAGQALTDFAVVANDQLVNAKNAHIVYSQSSGSLFYNQDGNLLGTGTVFEFATLGNLGITLSSSNFSLIA